MALKEANPLGLYVAGVARKLGGSAATDTAPRPVPQLEPDAAVSPDMVDCILMERVVDRDQAAFALLAERYATIALTLAHRIVRNNADAEEVVQESLMRVWMFAHRWRPDTAKFSSWFYRIVTNQAISRVRRKPMEPLDEVNDPADAAPGPYEQLAGHEIGTAIETALDRLPARQRAAIALCYDEGLSCAEAADAVGVSVGTMESLLFRARRSLRSWLEQLSIELGDS
jgi:RNA polymerase sigma-70 factor (ECF subfamily)